MTKPIVTNAIVTGASSGIGEELARLLAKKGFHVTLVARNRDKLDALAKELGGAFYALDLTDRKDRARLVEIISQDPPDLLVNNAGFGLYGDALEHSTEETMNMLELDVAALLELSLEGARAMIGAKKTGVIVNISSAAAFQIFPGLAVYAASKAFVNSFSESFDEEVKPHGIRVLTTCPGVVKTGFRKRASGLDQYDSAAMDVSFAAEEIWQQIQRGQAVRVFDWKYRLSTFLTRYVVPKGLLVKILKNALSNRVKK